MGLRSPLKLELKPVSKGNRDAKELGVRCVPPRALWGEHGLRGTRRFTHAVPSTRPAPGSQDRWPHPAIYWASSATAVLRINEKAAVLCSPSFLPALVFPLCLCLSLEDEEKGRLWMGGMVL